MYMCMCMCISMSMSMCMRISMSMSMCISMSMCMCISMPMCMCLYVYIYILLYLFIHMISHFFQCVSSGIATDYRLSHLRGWFSCEPFFVPLRSRPPGRLQNSTLVAWRTGNFTVFWRNPAETDGNWYRTSRLCKIGLAAISYFHLFTRTILLSYSFQGTVDVLNLS